jgi:hypothetical protein
MISENLICSDPTNLQCYRDKRQKRRLLLADLADAYLGVPITDEGLVGSGMVKFWLHRRRKEDVRTGQRVDLLPSLTADIRMAPNNLVGLTTKYLDPVPA